MFPEARPIIRLRAELARDLASARTHVRALATHRAALLPGPDAPPDAVLQSFAALTLHNFYTALESAFERIARTLDGDVPTGPASHRALLDGMALALPTIRPAVLSLATQGPLGEFLGFRHFVRHAYAVAWRPERLAELADLAATSLGAIEADFAAFDGFLATLIA